MTVWKQIHEIVLTLEDVTPTSREHTLGVVLRDFGFEMRKRVPYDCLNDLNKLAVFVRLHARRIE